MTAVAEEVVRSGLRTAEEGSGLPTAVVSLTVRSGLPTAVATDCIKSKTINYTTNIYKTICIIAHQNTHAMHTKYIPRTPIHITYRLHGSIPNLPLQHLHTNHRLQRLRLHAQFRETTPTPGPEELATLRSDLLSSDRQHYLKWDALLDEARSGPRYLASAAAREIVLDSWHTIARQDKLKIYAISVMDNHVHILLESRNPELVSLPDTLVRHKRFTSTALNRLHDAKGRRVWAEHEYSRTVRSGCFDRVLWYVLNNPVKAGITQDALGWEGNWWAADLYAAFLADRVA